MFMAEKTIERVYTIPLRSEVKKEPRSKRSNRAIREIQAFVRQHSKAKEIKLSKGVNELIFSRGFQKPPGRIKVEVRGDIERVDVKLPGEAIEEKKEKKKTGIAGLRGRLAPKEEGKKEAKKAKEPEQKEEAKHKERTEKEEEIEERSDEVADKIKKERELDEEARMEQPDAR